MRYFLRACCALLVTAVVLAAPVRANADEAQERYKAVIQLMKATNMGKLYTDMAKEITKVITAQIKATVPNVPQRGLDLLAEEINAGFKQNQSEYVGQIARIYTKYFSVNEMNDIVAFYRTETGAKTLEVMPKLMGESLQVGQVLGQRIAQSATQRAMERMTAEGMLN